jgi:ATP-dependent RNA helicase DHX57
LGIGKTSHPKEMAPKSSHGPRGKPKKAPAPVVPDSDHIVFTNNPNAPSQREKNEAPAAPRPDVRKVIGGASWTGKLPVNLLSELCQREKWNKPEYSMRKLPGEQGYRSEVTLSATNPKTKELTTLPPFHLPATHAHLANQETPLEARHLAATYALFRVSSMKNIHMTLPPKYRDLWKGDFLQLKQDDVAAGRAWKYDADPFAAEAKRRQIHLDMEKQAAQAAKAKANPESLSLVMPGRGGRPDRQWERAPKIEMGRKIRADIEDLVKSNMIWNPYGTTMTDGQRSSIVDEFAGLGFRRSHLEEAVQQCKDREETLEWLLIHVPEDDLPRWSFPEGYSAGISLASGDLAKEGKIKRLALGGYSMDECARALKANNGDEGRAAQELQDRLVPTSTGKYVESDGNEDAGVWEDELDSLQAIFGERFASTDDRTCTIMGDRETATVPVVFHFRAPTAGYPSAAPVISIQAELPAYIRLSATRQVVEYAQSNLLGGAMIFNLVEWLESNLQSICENPGPLRKVSLSTPDNMQSTSLENRTGIPVKKRPTAVSLKRNTGERRPALNPVPLHMLKQRQTLPAWNKRDAIIEAIHTHQCVIISGETGSGKSTQSVQFVLDHLQSLGLNANVVCTQPRRVAAISLADRVSSERGSSVGDEVGYIIRGESKVSARTKITFMTTGVLLRRLSSSTSVAQSDMLDALADITHIFVDEVHERSLDTDFLLALLRDVMKSRKDLKVVLMSATLEASLFSDYFGGSGKVGEVHIPGRTFPVTDVFLDEIVRMTGNGADDNNGIGEMMDSDHLSDGQRIRSVGMGINYNLIRDLVSSIDDELRRKNNPGGILIFLPGTLEIDRTLTALQGLPVHGLPLHASLTPAEQRQVFHPAPAGKRKVIASTNVAETSITIDDIVAVIDTGRVKETNYDPTDSIVRLEEVWASQAACKQRRGRAGRVQAGTCYKLFTRNVESKMTPRAEPEIRRVPLEQLCLAVKSTGPDQDVAQFLRRTLTPPDDQAIDVAMQLLHRIGALDDNHLTALGRHLAIIPADLRCAKLLVYGSIFSCMDACLTIAAILTGRSPFVSPREKREEAREARLSFSNGHGDLLLDMAAYDSWTEKSTVLKYRDLQSWCAEKFLSHQILRDISSTKSQLISSLKDTSVIPMDYYQNSASYQVLNERTQDMALLRALIAGALNPQIARIEFPDRKFAAAMGGAVELDPEAKTIKYFSQDNGRVFVHPSSTLFDAQTYSGSAAYLSYFSKMATSKTFIRELTRKYLPFLRHLPILECLRFAGTSRLRPFNGRILDSIGLRALVLLVPIRL